MFQQVDHAKAMLERAEEVFEFFIKDFNASTAKSPIITTWDGRAVAVEDVRVNCRMRMDRWIVECYEGLKEGWDEGRKKKYPREVLSQGEQSSCVWRKEMDGSLAGFGEGWFPMFWSSVGLEVIEVKQEGFQGWYMVRRRG